MCTKVILIAIVLFVFLSGIAGAEKPPLNNGRITGEILAGGTGAFALGALGGYIGLELDWGEDLDFLFPESSAIGIFAGCTLGSAVGVYIVGNIGNETGSFLATLGGSIVGMLAGLGSGLLDEEDLSIFTILAGPHVFATIAFNMTRRYDSPPKLATALINFKDGQMSFAAPCMQLQFARLPSGHIEADRIVRLMNAQF